MLDTHLLEKILASFMYGIIKPRLKVMYTMLIVTDFMLCQARRSSHT
jgi:hypothetical protein